MVKNKCVQSSVDQNLFQEFWGGKPQQYCHK